MPRAPDAQALQHLRNLLKSRSEDPINAVLRAGRGLPADWRESSLAELVVWLRRRCDMTQRQLAALSGLTRAKVAQIEAGQDVQWSTLCRLFAGFGCGLTVVPTCRLSAKDLWRRTHQLWGDGHIPRRRRYPRK
ncbi:MAG: helix-turn-helix transcriptional regulator [Elusimicrobia bacterium]|nr:helix-turn-helix transcriptional regulator [Elusimicrobiota bacterium]